MSTYTKVTAYSCLGSAVVLVTMLLGQGCGSDGGGGGTPTIFEPWSQFQSGSAGEGFLAVDTQLAVSLLVKWEVDIGRVSYGSPVIGPDGTVYVGNLEGELVAISPEGQERWRATFVADSIITSTPAVAEDGSIFVVTTHPSGSELASNLNRVLPNGTVLWSQPAIEDGRTTTASPRIFGEYVFLHVPFEVGVYDFDGNLLSRTFIGGCGTICGGSSILDSIKDFILGAGGFLFECSPVGLVIDSADCWDNFVFEFDGSTKLTIPALDPTVAIVASKNVVGDDGPIVVTLNSICMTGYRFNAPNLDFIWRRTVYGGGCDDKVVSHGSPAIVGGGMLVIANEKGKVSAYDPVTGSELWEYEAKGEVFVSTPASFVRPIFVASTSHAHILSCNGKLIKKRPLLGRTGASFALSSNFAYLSTSQGLFTFDFDLSSNFTVDGAGLHRLATPAIGEDGTVYAVTADRTLRAYSPTVGSLQISFQLVVFNEPSDGAELPVDQDTVFSADVFPATTAGFDGVTTFSSDIDGELCAVEGTGPNFSCEGRLMTLGEHIITVAALNATGTLTTDSIAVEAIEANTDEMMDDDPVADDAPPTVVIVAPADGATFSTGQAIAFTGNVDDPNETILSTNISWTSDQDGLLGTGEIIALALSEGTHIITLTAIDSGGLEGQDSVTIQVIEGNVPPAVQILAPQEGAEFIVGEVIGLTGEVNDPNETIPASDITWTSDRDGQLGTGASIATTLSEGTHIVTLAAIDSGGLQGQDSITIQVIVVMPPTVTIVQPANGSSFQSNETVAFQAQASDPQDGTLSGDSLVWVSDLDGPLGTGENLSLELSNGDHTIMVTATNSFSLSAEDSVTIEVVAGPGVPSVTILSPGNNTAFGPGQTITFQGSATDLEDGALPGSSFQWTSDIDGVLGSGSTLQTTLSGEPDPCGNTRTHLITLEVTDSDGNTTSQQISVRIWIEIC